MLLETSRTRRCRQSVPSFKTYRRCNDVSPLDQVIWSVQTPLRANAGPNCEFPSAWQGRWAKALTLINAQDTEGRKLPAANASQSIETARLLLRPHELTDFSNVRDMWADPWVVQHIFDRVQTEADSWSRLLRYRGHWDLLGYGYWAVINRESRAFLGEVGFADYRREIEPPFSGRPEAGWVMAAHAHGQGFAREAMDAALDWLETNMDAPRTVAMITPENTNSIRLAKALGYELTRTSVYNCNARLIFERVCQSSQTSNSES
ncbi:MAG: GNAT family N-acetyltransferase [Pseudomonadota bacterium]